MRRISSDLSIGSIAWLGLMSLVTLFPMGVFGEANDLAATGEELPTASQLKRWATDLGDARYDVRQTATRALWIAGEQGYRVIEPLVESRDREVAKRARWIVKQWRLGIRPDTPPDVVKWLNQYQTSSQNQKASLLTRMLDGQQLSRALRLVSAEDSATRKLLVRSISPRVRRLIREDVAAEKWTKVEEALTLAIDADDGFRDDYLAFFNSQGRLKELIRTLEADANLTSSSRSVLASCIFIQGNVDQAIAIASKGEDALLTQNLVAIWQPWSTNGIVSLEHSASEPERLGFQLIKARQQDDNEQFDRAAKQLVAMAAKDSKQTRRCAEALMVGHAWDEAISVHRESNKPIAFRLLLKQSRAPEALALFGVREPSEAPSFFADRRVKPKEDARKDTDWHRETFNIAESMLPLLDRLGHRDEAVACCESLQPTAKENPELIASLVRLRLMLSMQDEAFAEAIDGLEKHASSVLSRLFPGNGDVASRWLSFLRTKQDMTDQQELAHLRSLFYGRPNSAPPALSDDAFETLAMEFETYVRRQAPASRLVSRKTLAAVAKSAVQRKAVIELLEAAFSREDSSSLWLRNPNSDDSHACLIGDLYAKLDDWKSALNWYAKCSEHRPTTPLYVFLHGHALTKVGDVSGEQMMRKAMTLPLGDGSARFRLASQLKSRGMSEIAIEQFQFLLKLGILSSKGPAVAAARDASVQVYDHATTDKLLYATMSMNRHTRMISDNASYVDVRAYPLIATRLYRMRAMGLFDRKRDKEAINDIWIAHRATPGDLRVPLDVIPRLESSGNRNVADQLFDKVYQKNQEIVDQYPQSAFYHNEIAWLACRLGRRMDDAMKHASVAVQLRPDYPNFIDTLAEVHYRNGDREKALELIRRCIQLDSRTEHFQAQLARFEAGEP